MKALTLYPAIDLKGGRCVRLFQGAMDSAAVYNEDPVDQARRFASVGFDWLHVVDLDGAVAGAATNGPVVEAIVAATPARVQLGGGVRTLDAIETWLARGVFRVILGTVAVRDPTLVAKACRRFPGRIVVGVDARDGRVRTDGWAGSTDLAADELLRRFEGEGVAAAIYTDIGRDGALSGVNAAATEALAASVSVPIIASGGLSGLDDIVRLRAASHAIEGVVIGKALYEGCINPADALRAAAADATFAAGRRAT